MVDFSMFGGPDPYQGMFTPDQQSGLNNQWLSNLALSLMANSGPTAMPHSFGADIGKAGLSAQAARNEGAQALLKGNYLNSEMAGKNISTAAALDQLNRRLAIMGQPTLDASALTQPGGIARAMQTAGGATNPLQGLPNPATLNRQQAGDWTSKLAFAGFPKEVIEPFQKVALGGPIEGFANDGKGGLVEIAGGPQSQDQQVQQALTKLGFMQGPDGQWRNPAGAIASQADLAGAIAGARKNAELPAELTLDTARAGNRLWEKRGLVDVGAPGTDYRDLNNGAPPPGAPRVGLQPPVVTIPSQNSPPPAAPMAGQPGGSSLYKSPAPNPQTQEGGMLKKTGDAQGDTVTGWLTDAKVAGEQNKEINMMRQQLAGAKVGTGFDTRKMISDALATAGVDSKAFAGLPDPANAALFNQGVKDLLIARAKAFGANPSNAEDRRVEQSIVSASSPIEAAKAMLDWMATKNDQKIAKGTDAYKRFKGGEDPNMIELDYARRNSGAPAAPPEGATLIGRYQGKPVYQLPDGSKVVPD